MGSVILFIATFTGAITIYEAIAMTIPNQAFLSLVSLVGGAIYFFHILPCAMMWQWRKDRYDRDMRLARNARYNKEYPDPPEHRPMSTLFKVYLLLIVLSIVRFSM
ncbi:MAG: hypothetical protein R3Y07_04155 [Eubacteriales bacterium]